MSSITVYMSIIVYYISNMTHDNENVKWITYAHEKGDCTFSEEWAGLSGMPCLLKNSTGKPICSQGAGPFKVLPPFL